MLRQYLFLSLLTAFQICHAGFVSEQITEFRTKTQESFEKSIKKAEEIKKSFGEMQKGVGELETRAKEIAKEVAADLEKATGEESSKQPASAPPPRQPEIFWAPTEPSPESELPENPFGGEEDYI